VGRGSAAGCLISYLMDITRIDPLPYKLLFERFLNEGRIGKSLPDIDTDFPASRREEVKTYMEERYGREQVCSVGTYTTLQMKAAIKDLSRVMSTISPMDLNMLTSKIDFFRGKGFFVDLFKVAVTDSRLKAFIHAEPEIVNAIPLCLELPKSESVHPCATLILPSEKTAFQWLPIKKVVKDGQEILVTEWEGEVLEPAGFLKEDILGIKQLDKFEDILTLIENNTGERINIYTIPLADRRVYDFFKKGWNADVFHFGSPGLTGYCRELKPDNIEDLVAAISLYRPGGMELGFHTDYVLCKNGEKKVEYLWGTEEITKDTYGIIIYQEQIMQICRKLADYTLVEADEIRKALGKTLIHKIKEYRASFVKGAVHNGCDEQVADDIWSKLEKFAKYCFNRSHALAYSVTGYISQWLKVHYPTEYWTVAFKYALEPDYANYISEIGLSGKIKVMPADINKSRDDIFTDFKTKTIYWPLSSIKQCGDIATKQIMEIRDRDGQYFSFEEFIERNKFKGGKVGKAVVENLVLSGAFDEIENLRTFKDRYNLILQYRKINKTKIDKEKDLFSVNASSLTEDWFWVLQQKRLSGIAFFNYRDIVSRYIDQDVSCINIEDFQYESYADERKKVKIGGYIVEVEERVSKKKGKWCRVIIESNYTFVSITIWPEQYRQIEKIGILGKEKCLLLISGQIAFDSYHKNNVLQANDDTEFIILE
jgi:DNA polymerase-3 subunit alpha